MLQASTEASLSEFHVVEPQRNVVRKANHETVDHKPSVYKAAGIPYTPSLSLHDWSTSSKARHQPSCGADLLFLSLASPACTAYKPLDLMQSKISSKLSLQNQAAIKAGYPRHYALPSLQQQTLRLRLLALVPRNTTASIMRASIWAQLLLSSSATAQASSSSSVTTITAAPSVLESGVPAALIGSQYISELGTSTTYYCPVGQIWSTKGLYAACCADDPYQECAFAVSCTSTSLLVGPEGKFTITCSGTSSQTVCLTGLVYESTSGTAALTNVQCWSTWDGGPWVATNAGLTSAATASSTFATTTRSGASTSPSPTAGPARTGNLPSQTGQPAASNPVVTHAVIGGVIGGLALLISLGACLCLTCSGTGQERRRKWSSESTLFNSVRWGKGSDPHGESQIIEKTLTEDEERRATLAPTLVEEVDGTGVVMMMDDEPNQGRLSKEMHAEAHEIMTGNTAATQTMEPRTADDAASVASAASFRSALAHHVGD